MEGMRFASIVLKVSIAFEDAGARLGAGFLRHSVCMAVLM
jgi:hypothetical protein